jgi:hypothetical protein
MKTESVTGHVADPGARGQSPSAMTARDDQGQAPALRAAERIARAMDGWYVDPLLGLFVPWVGDVVSAGLGLYPVVLAWRRRAPKTLLARMLLNLSVDLIGGAGSLRG